MLVNGGRADSDAERVDDRLGIRERVGFVDTGQRGEQIFVVACEPLEEPVGVILVCSSVLADFLANYQREVNLARCLASAGFAVVRFHPSGTGNSDGDGARLTLATMQDDARWMRDQIERWYPHLPVSFIGTRWGGLAAAAAARDRPGAPLVLCEPMLDFRRYFIDAARSRAMSAIASGSGRGVPDVPTLIERDGSADILGHVIHQRLFDSTAGVDGAALLVDGPSHPALLVQFGGANLRPPMRKLEERLLDVGWQVESATIDLQESWWFRAGKRLLTHPELNSRVQRWLSDEMAKAATT